MAVAIIVFRYKDIVPDQQGSHHRSGRNVKQPEQQRLHHKGKKQRVDHHPDAFDKSALLALNIGGRVHRSLMAVAFSKGSGSTPSDGYTMCPALAPGGR